MQIDLLRADGAPIEDEFELVGQQVDCWLHMTNAEQDAVWDELHRRKGVGIHIPF